MARMTIAALAAVLLLACAHQAAAGRTLHTITPPTCPPQSCPSGYEMVSTVRNGVYGTSCGYECYTPIKMNCPASIGGPRTCGGTTNKTCPAVACAYSSSYSISGPSGCSTAQSKVDAFAFNNVTYNLVEGTADPIIKAYCDASNPTDNLMPLEAAVNATVNAFATSLAKTLTHYETYVCTCCLGNSNAYTVVKADVQAAAKATAQAMQGLLGMVSGPGADLYNDCFQGSPQLLAGAYAYAQALAVDVQIAIDKVYQQAVSNKGFNCGSTGSFFQPAIKTAIAKASACTFANIYAAAIDWRNGGAAYACAASATITGSLAGASVTCPLDLPCDCTPRDYQLNNLGFETGTFTPGSDGAPNWVVNDGGYAGFPPAIIESDILNVKGIKRELKAIEPRKMAVIPVGDYPKNSSISTTFTVPPCATKIYASYVFKCNDQPPNDLFNDFAQFNVTVKDGLTGNVVTEYPVYEDCKKNGYNSGFFCSSSSEVADGGASNGGDWTTIEIPVAPGVYTVDVVAFGKEQRTDVSCASKLYIDNIGFK